VNRLKIGQPTCNGELTHVDFDIGGKLVRAAVTREAIEDEVQAEDGLSAEDMCAFVRDNLSKVEEAVRLKLAETDAPADVLMIRSGEL
jgi:hypothetical protein